jgi:hypothetical protein
MYIYPQNFRPRTRKLGAYLLNGPRSRRRGLSGTWRRYDLRGLRGLGDDSIFVDPNTAYNPNLLPLPLTPPDTSNTTPLNTQSPNGPFIGPVQGGQQILNQMQQQAVLDTNPLDYVSPGAAIAAGLDPTTVNAAWTAGLARYPSQAAAIAAGIAPAVVTMFWSASRQYAATAPPTGLSGNTLLIGGGLILAFALLSGGRRGRR